MLRYNTTKNARRSLAIKYMGGSREKCHIPNTAFIAVYKLAEVRRKPLYKFIMPWARELGARYINQSALWSPRLTRLGHGPFTAEMLGSNPAEITI